MNADKPVDVAEVERKGKRFEALCMLWGSLVLTAVSVGLNVYFAVKLHRAFAAGVLLLIVGVAGIWFSVKQLAKNLRKPRR